MAQINLNISLDITDENSAQSADKLADIISARLEYLIGEEFGNPAITHRTDVNWGAELYVDPDAYPLVTDIEITA